MHAASVKQKSTQFEENICYVCGVLIEEEWMSAVSRWFYSEVLDLMKHIT